MAHGASARGEACGATPDQRIKNSWSEHEHGVARGQANGVGQQQWQHATHAEIHRVLEDQPATGEALPAGFLAKRQQGMAQVTGDGRGQKGDGVGQPIRKDKSQATQDAEVNGCCRHAHDAVAAQSMETVQPSLSRGIHRPGAPCSPRSSASTSCQALRS